MITIEEYKTYLINTYAREIDNSKDKRTKRKAYLENKYPDNYLNKIILDTSKIIDLINIEQTKNFYEIKIEENKIKYIELNLTGGWHSDVIYEDMFGNLISEYILKRYFGNMLIVEEKVIEREFDTGDPDVLSFDYEYYLYIQGFLNKNKIKEKTRK